jgi:uncharacterized membrane protein
MTRGIRAFTLIGVVMVVSAAPYGLSQPGVQADDKKPSRARTWVFVCPDGSSFVVRATDSEAWVFRAGSLSLRLEAVPSAMPLRYGQGDIQLVIDEDNGTLSESSTQTFTCRNDRQRAVWEHAKLDGVDFRGVGNEPPWILEIREMSRFLLITDYGANRIERSLPEPVSDNARNMTRWDAGDVQVEITAAICHDSMTGEAMNSRVLIHWQEKVLKGCGRPLH